MSICGLNAVKKKKNHRHLHNLRLYDHLRRHWCRHHQHYVILVCLKILVVDDVCLYVCLSVGRRLLFLLLLLSLNHDSSSSHLDMTFTVEWALKTNGLLFLFLQLPFLFVFLLHPVHEKYIDCTEINSCSFSSSHCAHNIDFILNNP